MIKQQFSLSRATPGRKVKVVSLAGGRGFHTRLLAMGLIPGAIIEVATQAMTGPCIITHNGCRLALGRGVAHKIIVSDLPSSADIK